MGESDKQKRLFLKSAAALAAGTVFSNAAWAQSRRVLGVEIPEDIFKVLPVKPLNYAQLADNVIQLEREAQQRALPKSLLGDGRADPIATASSGFYQMVVPRLVALIDRSESIDPGFADRAGSLLADLHASQYVIPEMLRLPASRVAAAQPATSQTSGPQSGILRELGQKTGLPSFITPTAAPAPIGQSVLPPISDGPILSFPDAPAPQSTPDARPPESAEQPVPSPDSGPDVPPQPADPPLPDTPDAPEIDPKIDDGPPPPLSRKKDYASLQPEYLRQYRTLSVRTAFAQTANWHLTMIRKSRSRYESVGRIVDVPWHFIAVIHALESSFNFRAHLHNGDFPLTTRTRQVPAGRPSAWLPPSDWESSAKDALRLLGFTGLKDWSLERTIHRLEAYNGMGYRTLGVPSPYLWSFSNHYDRGKYVADGRFSPRARSQQCGAVVMLKLLEEAGEIKLVPAAV